MKKVTLKQAKDELLEIFKENGAKFKTYDVEKDKEEENSSFVIDNTFMIDKIHIEREGVLNILVDYFKDKCVKNGGCLIDPITFVWTRVIIFDADNPFPNE